MHCYIMYPHIYTRTRVTHSGRAAEHYPWLRGIAGLPHGRLGGGDDNMLCYCYDTLSLSIYLSLYIYIYIHMLWYNVIFYTRL